MCRGIHRADAGVRSVRSEAGRGGVAVATTELAVEVIERPRRAGRRERHG